MSKLNQRVAFRIAVAVTVFACATGFTDCEYFETVTVPATDTSRPVTFEGVYASGEYIDSTVDAPIVYHLPAANQRVFAVGAAMDGGGVRKLTLFSGQSYTCCRRGLCSTTRAVNVPQSETQSGTIGSPVSNGIYLYDFVSVPACSTGWTLRDFSHGWHVTAEDFHGNTRTSMGSAVVYP